MNVKAINAAVLLRIRILEPIDECTMRLDCVVSRSLAGVMFMRSKKIKKEHALHQK